MGKETPPAIVIIGLGAVGGVLTAGLLAKAPDSVRVIVKKKHLPVLQKEGLTLEGGFSRHFHLQLDTTLNFSLADTLVVPMVKAYDLPAVIRQLIPRMVNSTRLLVLQNGIGIRGKIRLWSQGAISNDRLYRGTVAFGATLRTPGQVRYFDGRMVVEERFRRSRWFERFDNSFFSIHTTRNLPRVLWKKLLVNSIYNPLSLILGVSNRTLSEEALNPLKDQLLQEGLKVASAEGIRVSLTVEELNRLVRSDNLTSMYQDFQYGRNTELHFITGELIRAAEAHSLAVPAHRFLRSLVRTALWIRDHQDGNPASQTD